MSQLMTTGDVARTLGLSILKVRTLIEQGKIAAINTSCGSRPRWSIRREDLEAFLQPSNVRSESPRPAATRRRRIDADVPQIF